MATNRLYLYDPVTGDHLLIAKSMAYWRPVIGPKAEESDHAAMVTLAVWLSSHDVSGATGGPSDLELLDENALLKKASPAPITAGRQPKG